ncbi:MAG: SpoIVB peptidase [Clostridiales bacterium]|nr:SpoIVB peptidase [Clostridiales bacterium]
MHFRKPYPTRARRMTGWLLSALLLAIHFSPQATLLRTLPDSLSIAAGQQLSLSAAFPLKIALQGDSLPAGSSTDQTLANASSAPSTATISLFGLLPLKEVTVDVQDDLRLHPGGQAVGVALHTHGVLVVGTSDLTGTVSPARVAGLKPGDLITQVGDDIVESTDMLTQMVAAAGETALPLTVLRGESTLSLTLTPRKDTQTGSYRIGAWVRDSTAGVGTLSFYGEVSPGEGMRYGALGHAITDADTQQLLTVGHGEIMTADVVDVRKGQSGYPGELKGSFLRQQHVLGGIRINNRFGIYGALSELPAHPLYPDGLPIGRRDAVHTGKATILSTVDAGGMKEYDVEIVEVNRQSQPAQRSMVVKVVDEELLSKTGGIVQGMSGSPIIQDGRLIGAVTHVFVNDPTMGYGLYIEWMLEECGKT